MRRRGERLRTAVRGARRDLEPAESAMSQRGVEFEQLWHLSCDTTRRPSWTGDISSKRVPHAAAAGAVVSLPLIAIQAVDPSAAKPAGGPSGSAGDPGQLPADDHRRRLTHIGICTRRIRKCLRKHLITDYLPAQCVYNMGEYPSRTPWEPEEYY